MESFCDLDNSNSATTATLFVTNVYMLIEFGKITFNVATLHLVISTLQHKPFKNQKEFQTKSAIKNIQSSLLKLLQRLLTDMGTSK